MDYRTAINEEYPYTFYITPSADYYTNTAKR